MHRDLLPYTNTIIRLFQGIVYLEDKEWKDLQLYQSEIHSYFLQIGLKLVLDDAEGYAFLKQEDFGEDENPPLKLISKRQLTYSVSVLCVLLREELLNFDNSSSETGKLILSKEEILNLAQGFYADATSNEAKRLDKIQSDINKLLEYGFLKWHNESKGLLEVKRILRAIIEAEKLVEIKEKMVEYAKRNV